MNMRSWLLLSTMVCASVLLVSCGSSPTAGGGSDLPNGALALVTGSVVLPDSSVSAGTDVTLRKTVVTSHGDSTAVEFYATTDDSGEYVFDAVPAGRYVLLAETPGGDLTGLNQFVEVFAEADTQLPAVRIAPPVTLVGFVELPPGYYASRTLVGIPGTTERTALDMNRMYMVENAPRGVFDLVISYGSIANYMRVRVGGSAVGDSVVHLRNVTFAVMDVMADTVHSFHESEMSRNYAVTPHVYEQGGEPPWYAAVDLSQVAYFEWEGDSLIAWDENQPYTAEPYEELISGMVYEGAPGQVLMERVEGDVVELVSFPMELLPSEPVFMTVAAVPTQGSGRLRYEVIDVLPVPPEYRAPYSASHMAAAP